MNNLFTFLCIIFTPLVSLSQLPGPIKDEYGRRICYGVSSFRSDIELFVEADTNTKYINPFNSLTNDPLGSVVYLEGATDVKVTTRIKKDSLPYYRYSVIENDTSVKVWNALLSEVDFVWIKGSSFPGYLTMNLGISDVKDKKITIKIFRFPKVQEITTLIIYSKPLPSPKIISAILLSPTKMAKPWQPGLKDLIDLKQDTTIRVTETTTGIAITKEVTDLDFAYYLLLKYTKGNETYVRTLSNDWNYGGHGAKPMYLVGADNFRVPGEYEILVQAVISEARGVRKDYPIAGFKFSVASPPITFSMFQLGVVTAIIICLALLTIFIIRRNNNNRLVKSVLTADLAKSELNMVRAQLNPHFVFNALSGIQGLMNNNSIEKANNYLGKFASLTRRILDDQEMISIGDEIALVQNYLDMEQLRFPFIFELHADQEKDFIYTEIPSMLLQPFVENAVKHGITSLHGKGRLAISIRREQQNIVMSVKDNGKGFDRSEVGPGLGLKLSEKRIALLNDIYKTCPIDLVIRSSSGTIVQITLNNWFA